MPGTPTSEHSGSDRDEVAKASLYATLHRLKKLRRHELQVWFLAEHLVDTPAVRV